jgi:hypothetical protein
VSAPGLRVSISGTLGLFSAACLVAGVVVNARPSVGGFLWDCPVKSLFDVPCFSCGITRVYMHLASGQVLDALALAPLPFLAAVLSLFAGAWHLYAKTTGKVPLPDAVIGRWLLNGRFKLSLMLGFFGLWGYAMIRSLLTGAP